MTRSFIHDSDSRAIDGRVARLEIEVSIVASSEDEAWGEVESIKDLERDVFLDLKDLPEVEQRQIQTAADEIAYENAHDVWLEQGIARAEAAYDAWKDGDS